MLSSFVTPAPMWRRLGRAALASLCLLACAGTARAGQVWTYHGSNNRHGLYVVPGLTLHAAEGVKPDTAFSATVNGNVYAQPLYWQPKGATTAELIVATENNVVYALNASTGAVLWQRQLPAAITSGLPCGDISPEGITGTPVIDPATGTLYLNSQTASSGSVQHELYALSLADGSILSGWPINVQSALQKAGVTFTPPQQGERGGLLFFDGALYAAYGGRDGDCNPYHGTIVQIDPATQALTGNWETRAAGGGIWAQGGISSDGKYIFATTGNTFNANNVWSDGEAIIRLLPGLVHSTSTTNFYTPSNWQSLDNSDLDLGGTEALPLNVDKTSSSQLPRLVALGKDGNAYLVSRSDLGGIGGPAVIKHVSNNVIITAPAVYEAPNLTLLAFTNFNGIQCAGQQDLQVLELRSTGTNQIIPKWCAALSGEGSPIITTTDGTKNPIVWVVGAEGDNQLHAFNAVTGGVLYTGTTAMSGLHRFQTLIAAGGKLYVAGDNKVYAFTFSP